VLAAKNTNMEQLVDSPHKRLSSVFIFYSSNWERKVWKIMGEYFEAIGLSLPNTAPGRVVEYSTLGRASSIYRRRSVYSRRCLRLVMDWSRASVRNSRGMFCADCRPGFRSKRVYSVSPWNWLNRRRRRRDIDGAAWRHTADIALELKPYELTLEY